MKTRLKFHKSPEGILFTDVYPGINGPTSCVIRAGEVRTDFNNWETGYSVDLYNGETTSVDQVLTLKEAKTNVKNWLRSEGITFYDEVRRKRTKKKK